MAHVFLDGRFVERDEARVAAFDAGLQHGVGLFETMQARISGGEAFVRGLEDHMRRLSDSAAQLGLSDSLRTEALAEAVVLSAERAGYERARVRLTITGGDLNLLSKARAGVDRASEQGAPAPRTHNPTILIDVQPATEYPAEMFERGVGVAIADARANPFNPFEGHKTLNYWWRLRALQEAAAKRVAESLVFSITNHLAGGCVSNAFLVRAGELWTPIARGEEVEAAGLEGPDGPAAASLRGAVLPSPVLPGITREEVIESAGELGIPVRRRMIAASDVLGADEVFLTNSSWGILPVVRVEAAAIAGGEVGTLTRRLLERWQRGWADAAL